MLDSTAVVLGMIDGMAFREASAGFGRSTRSSRSSCASAARESDDLTMMLVSARA
jgi:hypothetical protein